MSKATEKKFAELAELKPGWDSYGAKPITPVSLLRARVLLKLFKTDPTIVPTSTGGVQLEWHAEGFDVELEILPSGQLSEGDE